MEQLLRSCFAKNANTHVHMNFNKTKTDLFSKIYYAENFNDLSIQIFESMDIFDEMNICVFQNSA